MTSTHETLEELSKEYQDAIPADLREYRTFEWYLDKLYDEPKVARNAHQRVADMFDFYGTEYDEDAGVVEYELASEDPTNDGENTFYGRVVHEAIHEFVNKVKSGARGLGPERRILLLLGPVGSGKSDFPEPTGPSRSLIRFSGPSPRAPLLTLLTNSWIASWITRP